MKKLLLPLVMLIAGTGGGVAAAVFLAPSPQPDIPQEPSAEACAPETENCEVEEKTADVSTEPQSSTTEFAKMANQFVIPVVTDAQIEALVVVSIGIEVPEGQKDPVFQMEPKLRDRFMQVLFNHANIGGFSGNFTSNENMRILRTDLLRSAKSLLGDTAQDILILEIVRQDA